MDGLGQGIVSGMQLATQGMVNREKIQQQATQFNQQMQTGAMQQANEQLKYEQLQMQIQETQNQIAKRDTYDALFGFEQTGDASVLNSVKANPIMSKLLQGQGISGFSNISDLSEDKKVSLGITPELLNDNTKRIVIANTADGRQVAMDMMKIYATTGFLPKLGEQKLADITLQSKITSAETEQLKLEDMQNYLEQNPGATLADYMQKMKSRSSVNTDTADMKNLKFESEQTGIPIDELIMQKREQKSQQAKTSKMKDTEFNTGKWNTVKQESGVKDIYDVDYTKLSDENRTWFDEQARDQAKDIKDDERNALFSLASAADKLNVEDLKDTTGIVDATFNQIFDRLGLDLPDEELVQSANYNLIKNAIVKAAMGSQVTGNELERMTAQLGTEFRADKTVRIKMAETLDNLVAKYESYKVIAHAFYARGMKPQVDNMKQISNYLRSDGKTPKEETKVWQGVTYKKVGNKWIAQGAE